MVTDAVWDRLDHDAGTATRGEIRRLRVASAALVAAVLLVLAASATGAVVPRLAYDESDPGALLFTDGVTGHAVVRLEHTVVNDGWFPVTVTGAGLRADGLRLVEVRESEGRAFPLTVSPGESIRLALTAAVLDCERAAATAAESPLRVRRWWGSQTVSPAPDTYGSWEQAVTVACER